MEKKNKSKSRQKGASNKRKNVKSVPSKTGMKRVKKIGFAETPNAKQEEKSPTVQSTSQNNKSDPQTVQDPQSQPPVNNICEDGKCSIVRPKNRRAAKRKRTKSQRPRRKTKSQAKKQKKQK